MIGRNGKRERKRERGPLMFFGEVVSGNNVSLFFFWNAPFF